MPFVITTPSLLAPVTWSLATGSLTPMPTLPLLVLLMLLPLAVHCARAVCVAPLPTIKRKKTATA
jgi:hypothetical protein